MLSFEAVSKSYRLVGERKVILRQLTLDLPARNIAVLGCNGAGKSTLLALIAGTELPDSGVIRRRGRVSWPLGFSASFNGSLTGAENVRFVARIYGQDTERVIEFVKDFSELGGSLHMPVATYSSGMRARLAFGVSMAVNFNCYLIDEITEVGDASFKAKCRSVFKERLKDARIIMVSHSVQTLRSYCDMGLVLHGGEAIAFERLADAIAYYETEIVAGGTAGERAGRARA
jgi:capsular polysaccharide transport system ATP-binding protein